MSTDAPDAQVQPVTPRKTSLNEPTYEGAPAGAEQVVPSAPPGERGQPGRPGPIAGAALAARRAQRDDIQTYSLLAPPNFDSIVGGEPPSPIVSLFTLAGILGMLAAALVMAAGMESTEWWLFAGLFLLIGVTLAGFISRSA